MWELISAYLLIPYLPIVNRSSGVSAVLYVDGEQTKSQEAHAHAKAQTIHCFVAHKNVTLKNSWDVGHHAITESRDLNKWVKKIYLFDCQIIYPIDSCYNLKWFTWNSFVIEFQIIHLSIHIIVWYDSLIYLILIPNDSYIHIINPLIHIPLMISSDLFSHPIIHSSINVIITNDTHTHLKMRFVI